MNFGAPGFAWAALALIPLVAVYFIRTRPRRQQVNAFFLWEQVFQQKAASSLFQRLRNLLSLLIMALAFGAAVASLTKPQFGEDRDPDLLIVLDRSVSMQGGAEQSRMAEAIEKAAGWIAALEGSQRAALATADTRLEYKVHLTGNARPLRDALEGIEASDLPLDPGVLEELALLAEVQDDDESRVRILFLTDGRSGSGEVPAGVETVIVGEDDENAGITAADLRWTSRDEASLFVSMLSGFSEEKEVELELVEVASGRVARLFTMKVPPGGEASESIQVDGVAPGAWLLRMNLEDALAADNLAPLGLNAPQPVPVQVGSPNPFFFQQVVSAFARADSLFEPIDDFAHLGLAEGPPPETPVSIVFSPSGESAFWTSIGDVLPPGPPEIVRKDHPLVARIDPALLTFEGARKLTVPEGSVVVLEHVDGTPLLYTATAEGRKAVVINLDPSLDDFFLSPWFPVLVHDATALLMGRSDDFPSAVPTGSDVVIPGTGEVASIVYQGRDEEAVERDPVPVLAVDDVGNYEMSRSSTTWRLGAGVLSPGESGAGGGSKVELALEPASGWPLAAWLLLAAAVAVMVEEMLYHRRKVG
ncbi:BatA domain-containing protein [Haloferula chungangensis]|uniref:BatA domain-containing protein n=1 Tax=Haloferula chungangensis TaxID=1048331 RepID=A0ABW2L3S4_9BACT